MIYFDEINDEDLVLPSINILTTEVLSVYQLLIRSLKNRIGSLRRVYDLMEYLNDRECEDFTQFNEFMFYLSCQINQQDHYKNDLEWKQLFAKYLHTEFEVDECMSFVQTYYDLDKCIYEGFFYVETKMYAGKKRFLARHPKDLMNIVAGQRKACCDYLDLLNRNLLQITS